MEIMDSSMVCWKKEGTKWWLVRSWLGYIDPLVVKKESYDFYAMKFQDFHTIKMTTRRNKFSSLDAELVYFLEKQLSMKKLSRLFRIVDVIERPFEMGFHSSSKAKLGYFM